MPAEMRSWLDQRERVLERAAELRDRQAAANTLQQRIQAYRQELSRLLVNLDQVPAGPQETLAALLDRCQRVTAQIQAERQEREQADAEVARLEGELHKARERPRLAGKELEAWRREWAQAIAPLGLTADATPEQVDEVLQQVDALFAKRQEAEQLAEALYAHLSQAGQNRATRKELEGQLESWRASRREAQDTIREADAELTELCRIAGCESPAQLEQVEQRWHERTKAREALRTVQENLRSIAPGVEADELARQAAEIDPDTLDGRLRELSGQIERAETERTAAITELGGLEEQRRRMDGSAAAAQAAEEAQSHLARIRTDAERYMHLRMAERMLRREIERYRREHQGPLLGRAGELFHRITLSSFTGLRAEYAADDKPVVAGIRPDGSTVGLDAMSDGTRDQLYLALRLASPERHVTSNEPMPFIVDDILIRFDDERSRATLEALAEFAARAQVLFFTHHRRLADLGETAGDGVYVHEL